MLRDRATLLVCCLGVAVAATVPYVRLPAKPLVHDAPRTIVQNQVLQQGSVGEILGHDVWGLPLDAPYSTRSWRPFASLTWAAQVRLLGQTAFGLHVADVVLHAAAATLVLLLALALGIELRWATIAALLFAVHPVATEAVASVVGRADLLAGVALLAALVGHLRAAGSRWRMLLEAAALGALVVALASKEYAVAFPFVLMAFDGARAYARREPIDRATTAVWGVALAVLAIYLMLRYAQIGALGGVPMLAEVDHPLARASFATRVATALRLILLAVRLLVAPVALNHHYRVGTLDPVGGFGDPLALGGLALLLGFGAWAVLRLRRGAMRPAAILALFLLPLAPALNVVSLSGVLFAERHLYVPLAALGLAVGALLDRLRLGRPGARVALGLAALALCGLAYASARRVEDWSSDERLARASLKSYPRGAEVWRDLGITLGRADRHAEAEEAFAQATQINPTDPQAWQGRATALVNLRRYDAGAAAWRRAIELTPREAAVQWRGLGETELLAGRAEAAVEALDRALELGPADERARTLLAQALLRWAQQRLAEGRASEALDLVRRARQDAGLAPEGHYLAGTIAWAAGAREEARAWFDEARRRDPDLLRKQHDLAVQLEGANRYAEAAEVYAKMLLVEPERASTLFNLGRALVLAGRPAEAIAPLERGLARTDDARARTLLEEARRLARGTRPPG